VLQKIINVTKKENIYSQFYVFGIQGQTMQAMYSSVARELKTTQLTDEHPQDYLNFYSLSNREDFNEESSSTWCTGDFLK